jgi:hypothetical protein
MSSPARSKDSAERFYAFSGAILFKNSSLAAAPGVLRGNVPEHPSVVEVSSVVNAGALHDLLSVPKRRATSVPPARKFDKSGQIEKSSPLKSPGAARGVQCARARGAHLDQGSLNRAPNSPRAVSIRADDVRRRMMYVRERQAAYDKYNALPRNVPNRAWSEAEFAAKLDGVMGDNELKRAASQKLVLTEAMAEQREQRRHEEWTKAVYEPIVTAIADKVDAEFPAIHNARRAAYDGFLRATDPENVTGGRVFLDGNTVGGGSQAYNPWELRESATVRVRVPVKDPLKIILDKRAREAALVREVADRTGGSERTYKAHEWLDRSPERLPAPSWTRGMLETLPFGHFEAVDARTAQGAKMAFAGKDNEAHRQGFDFDETASFERTQMGRVVDVDKEFPRGRRTGEFYGQNKPTHTTRHVVPGTVYDYFKGSDAHFTDKALLDPVRPAAMAAQPAKRGDYGTPHSPRLPRKLGSDPLPDKVRAETWAGHILAANGGAGVAK